MYQNRRFLAVIPARGGSKGIPHKNIADLCGRPLISYTIRAGLESRYLDYVMVSTDDEEIAAVSKEYGAEIPFMRPAEFARDESKTIDVIIHAIGALRERGMEFDALVLLQPTQPARTAEDIDRAIEQYMENGEKPLVSVCSVKEHPLLMRSIENGELKPFIQSSSTCRRQDFPPFYRVNGCIYINRIRDIGPDTSFNDNIIPYVMPENRSVDIDEPSDLYLAGYYLSGRE